MPQLLYEKHNIQIYACEYVQIFCNQRSGQELSTHTDFIKLRIFKVNDA